jgi:hypothetical protein
MKATSKSSHMCDNIESLLKRKAGDIDIVAYIVSFFFIQIHKRAI